MFIALLERDHGATIAELIAATGWLAHTTRAALTGLRKRGYAVSIDRSEALSREPNLARARIGSLNSGSGCGRSSPRLESFFSEDAERAAGCEMALDVECVLDDGVHEQEALG